MVIRKKIKLPTLTGEKERQSYVYLPVGYEESGRSYPVVYMFDGHNLFTDEEATFGKCWGLEEYLDRHETPLIVAAVECNHEGNMRLSEYSPVDFNFRGQHVKGRGKKYMACNSIQALRGRQLPHSARQKEHYDCGQFYGRAYDALRPF